MKTSTLTGAALDKAVALALNGMFELGARRTDLKFVVIQGRRYGWGNKQACGAWAPSIDWSQGGPIIERERIELCSYSNDGVDTAFRSMGDEQGNYSHEEEYVVTVPEVVTWTAWVKYGSHKQDGPTPLIAAMRCFVSSRVGDTVKVPDELA